MVLRKSNIQQSLRVLPSSFSPPTTRIQGHGSVPYKPGTNVIEVSHVPVGQGKVESIEETILFQNYKKQDYKEDVNVYVEPRLIFNLAKKIFFIAKC